MRHRHIHHHLLPLLLVTTSLPLPTLAQSPSGLPTNLSFKNLVTSFLPYLSNTTAYILSDKTASAQLANAPKNPVTIFLTLDTPFLEFTAEAPISPEAARIEKASATNATLNSDLWQYLQVDGLYTSAGFNGSAFLRTRLNASPFDLLSGGNRVEVFRNSTDFWLGTGIGFKSNVVIPDIPFDGGILHIVDHPCAPPYTLSDTGTVLNISFIKTLTSQIGSNYPAGLDNEKDVTVFAVQNPAMGSLAGGQGQGNLNATLAQYLVVGEVLYSSNLTDLEAGRSRGNGTVGAMAGAPALNVTSDAQGNVFVNGSMIVESDILVRNGVVHVLEGPFETSLSTDSAA